MFTEQKQYYSGKKWQHTRKTQMLADSGHIIKAISSAGMGNV